MPDHYGTVRMYFNIILNPRTTHVFFSHLAKPMHFKEAIMLSTTYAWLSSKLAGKTSYKRHHFLILITELVQFD